MSPNIVRFGDIHSFGPKHVFRKSYVTGFDEWCFRGSSMDSHWLNQIALFYGRLLENSFRLWKLIFSPYVAKFGDFLSSAPKMCFGFRNLERQFSRQISTMAPSFAKFADMMPKLRLLLLPAVQQLNICFILEMDWPVVTPK